MIGFHSLITEQALHMVVTGVCARLQSRSVPAIVERLVSGLVPALQSGEEAGTLHARRLTTALQVSITCSTCVQRNQLATFADLDMTTHSSCLPAVGEGSVTDMRHIVLIVSCV